MEPEGKRMRTDGMSSRKPHGPPGPQVPQGPQGPTRAQFTPQPQGSTRPKQGLPGRQMVCSKCKIILPSADFDAHIVSRHLLGNKRATPLPGPFPSADVGLTPFQLEMTATAVQLGLKVGLHPRGKFVLQQDRRPGPPKYQQMAEKKAKECEDLKAKHTELLEHCEMLKKNESEAKAELTIMRASNEKLEQEIQRFQSTTKDNLKEMQDRDALINDMRATTKKLDGANYFVQVKKKRLEEDVEKAHETLKNNLSKIEEKDKEIANIEAINIKKDEALFDCQNRLQEIMGKLYCAETDNKTKDLQIQDKENNIEKLKEIIHKKDIFILAREEMIKVEKDFLRGTVETAQKTLATSVIEIKERESKMSSLKAKIKERESKIASLEAISLEKDTLLADCKNELHRMKDKLDHAEAENKARDAQNQEMKNVFKKFA